MIAVICKSGIKYRYQTQYSFFRSILISHVSASFYFIPREKPSVSSSMCLLKSSHSSSPCARGSTSAGSMPHRPANTPIFASLPLRRSPDQCRAYECCHHQPALSRFIHAGLGHAKAAGRTGIAWWRHLLLTFSL
ncbi:MAG: hypothetical protein Q7T62_11855 [Undibacterium sp.]|nr:hypothetical protein [Undibacterium sp.]